MCLGIPMKVAELLPGNRARVESGDVSLEISTELIENITPESYVIVHAGFALEVLDEKAAQETIRLINKYVFNDEK
ncbi:HypC/HybG/HupF family hydrogenase formation chaperone [candidate division KSB1 bacterium]